MVLLKEDREGILLNALIISSILHPVHLGVIA